MHFSLHNNNTVVNFSLINGIIVTTVSHLRGRVKGRKEVEQMKIGTDVGKARICNVAFMKKDIKNIVK